MSKKSKQSTPDPVAVARAQSEANKAAVYASAETNAVNQYGPGGSVEYDKIDRNGYMVPIAQRITLTPSGQAAFDAQERATATLASKAERSLDNLPRTPYDTSYIPYDPRSYDTSRIPQFSATSTARPSVWGGRGVGGWQPSAPDAPAPTAQPGEVYYTNTNAPPQQPSGQGQGGVWNLPGTTVDQPYNLPYDPNSYGDISAIDRGASKAVMSEFYRSMGPQFELQQRRLDQKLHDRGLPFVGEAGTRAQADLYRAQNDALLGAANQAYSAGHSVAQDRINTEQTLRENAYRQALGAHQQAMSDFGARTQLEQNLRATAVADYERQRNAAFNEASMYLRGSPAIQQPNAAPIPTYQIAAPDIGGYMYNSANMANQQAAARNQSMASGIGSLAMAAAMWSSSALKDDVKEPDSFLSRAKALPIKSWRYSDEAAAGLGLDTNVHIGPMAQQFAEQFGGDGVTIHHGDALFCLWKAFQELAAKVEGLESRLNG